MGEAGDEQTLLLLESRVRCTVVFADVERYPHAMLHDREAGQSVGNIALRGRPKSEML